MRSTKLWQYVVAVGTGLMLCGAAQAQEADRRIRPFGDGKAYQRVSYLKQDITRLEQEAWGVGQFLRA
jgi:hypothetical protein